MKITDRKLDHLVICTEKEVEAGSTGLEKTRLLHEALPELDFRKIDTQIRFLGKKLDHPIIIEAMTGGVKEASRINKDVATIAQELNIGFGVGSQRAAIDKPTLQDTFRVRDVAPDIFLIGNLGAVQFNYGYSTEQCQKAIEMIDADALALHLNPLQEIVQTEGNTDFSNLAKKINTAAQEVGKPVIVKETGCGISKKTASRLKVSAIDVGGMGGTSWSLVESYRSGGLNQRTGERFARWGIPTAECLTELSGIKTPLIASGGIRTGVDAAKALALGASCVGVALPVLEAWKRGGTDGVRDYLSDFIHELKVCMFLTGSGKIVDIKGKIKQV